MNLPPGQSVRNWSPITATLISGERDAVLVDALMTTAQGRALADWVAASKKNLTTVYITHGHGDQRTRPRVKHRNNQQQNTRRRIRSYCHEEPDHPRGRCFSAEPAAACAHHEDPGDLPFHGHAHDPRPARPDHAARSA